MLATVITLRFNPLLGGFDDTELRRFIADKEILSMEPHFFVYENIPHIAFTVIYCPLAASAERQPTTAQARQRDESWRKQLTEQELPLFNQMREWRAHKSKIEGVPPYVIFTNRQLAQLVRARPRTLADLARVDGVGKAKLEKYGEAILDLLRVRAPSNQTKPANPEAQEVDDES